MSSSNCLLAIQLSKTIIGKFETVNPRLAKKYIFAGQFVTGKKVLDLGCAAGYGSYYLAAKAGAKQVTGVDISKKAIAKAQTNHTHPKIQYYVGNAQKLPFEDNSFEVVVSLEVIEHVQNYKKFLSEVARVCCQPDGLTIMSTPNKAVTSPNLKYPLMVSHTKEFYIEELEEELKKYFSKVTLQGEDAARSDLETHLKTWRGKLQKVISQNPLVRLAARYTPQALNDIFTGGKAVPSNVDLKDVKITPSPQNAMTIVAVCEK